MSDSQRNVLYFAIMAGLFVVVGTVQSWSLWRGVSCS